MSSEMRWFFPFEPNGSSFVKGAFLVARRTTAAVPGGGVFPRRTFFPFSEEASEAPVVKGGIVPGNKPMDGKIRFDPSGPPGSA
ncbi:hypothetical protein ROR02_02780 [Pararhodospirillum oryzae]|uniref:Uncharacterized protein n=1 Tax=Pararhodospirillum oryzae TaxID=478448 RepID=A0A512H3Y1_9PROT|nr:hypothetical protein ROR02_02780 [Pararhodospirillum oryzae]